MTSLIGRSEKLSTKTLMHFACKVSCEGLPERLLALGSRSNFFDLPLSVRERGLKRCSWSLRDDSVVFLPTVSPERIISEGKNDALP